MHALELRTFVHGDRGNLQVVHIGAEIVLGIRDRGQQNLLDQDCRLLVAEGEQVGGVTDRQTTHLVGDQTHLLGRDTRTAQHCFGFHRHDPAFASAAFLSPE